MSKKVTETSAEKFQRIAAPRMNAVLTRLDTLAKASRTPDYKYTAAQVRVMEQALMSKVAETISCFRSEGGAGKAKGFTF